MVDMPDLESGAEMCASSSLAGGTTNAGIA